MLPLASFAIFCLGKTCGGILCLCKTCRRHLLPGGIERLLQRACFITENRVKGHVSVYRIPHFETSFVKMWNKMSFYYFIIAVHLKVMQSGSELLFSMV